MTEDILALLILVAAFTVASVFSVHMGAVTLAVALVVGTTMAGLSMDEILAGFPVDIMLLLLGVTYLFAIASRNGALGDVVDAAIARVGDRIALIPWVLFFLAAGIAALGSPMAAFVLIPVAMSFCGTQRLHPAVMSLAVITGGSAGAFAPTSLFGIITVGISDNAGITVPGMALFGYAAVCNAALLMGACVLFRQRSRTATQAVPGVVSVGASGQRGTSIPGGGEAFLADASGSTAVAAHRGSRAERVLSLCGLSAFVVTVLVLTVLDRQVDVGAIALVIGVVLALAHPKATSGAVKDIDWSTILLVGGILTYVAVLQQMGAVDRLGELASKVDAPLLAAFVVCVIGALVSAFASTTGILAVLIPLSLPLIETGGVPAAGLIIALAISANLVDSTPFSTGGAISVASVADSQKSALTRVLIRWGFSMVLIGPIVGCAFLVAPGTL